MSTPRERLLVDADQLAAFPREKLVVLGVSREPAAGDAIPGAFRVNLVNDLAGPPGGIEGGHPLPGPEALSERFRRWGVHDDSTVVVYSDTGQTPSIAARAWFVLRWAGLADVRLLDGGLAAWTAAGNPVEAPGERSGIPGTAVAKPGQLPTLDADEAARVAEQGLLHDSRGSEPFSRGHIPGAHSLPVSELFHDGRLLPADELSARIAHLDEPSTYCGAGVAATGVAFAFATLGITVPVYVASWTGWTADRARPVAT